MKTFEQFVNESIKPKKKKGIKKTFIPVILPKPIKPVEYIPEEEDLELLDPSIPIPRVRVH
jgi:hypothetical protein